uniref:Uncharacterized protein n=1 Tax=Anguilla anguilla TaxID=7936 RepID=A0A0E9S9M9_ANGAN
MQFEHALFLTTFCSVTGKTACSFFCN